MQHYTNGNGSLANGHMSYDSSSGGSYGGAVNIHSRSESGTSQTQYDDPYATPSPKTLIQDYGRPELVVNGSGRMSAHSRTSLRVRQSDPMAMHLLLETALGDSQHYDILSPEELEDLKKEEQALSRKIQGRRKKLFLESRMHSTSRSLQRLDSRNGNGSIPENEGPAVSEKCAELADELWRLEKHQTELQDRRLKHTAGVLQLNHQLQSQSNSPRELDGTADDDGFDMLDGILGGSEHLAPRLQEICRTLYDIIGGSGSKVNDNLNFPEPPPPGTSAEEKVEYIEHSLNTVRGLHDGLKSFLDDTRQKSRGHEQNSKQANDVLTGLWDFVDGNAQHIENNREMVRAIVGDDTSDNEPLYDPSQPFSAQNFSARIQAICNQAANLSDQQIRLQQDLRQQRELHVTKTAERAQMLEDMQNLNDQHLSSQRALQETRSQLAESKGSMGQAAQQMEFARQQQEAAHSQALSSLQSQLASVQSLASQHEAAAKESSRDLSAAQADREELESELIRLQTELTISRAELDGAYGTRAQRALESSKGPKHLEDLTAKNVELGEAKAEVESKLGSMEKELGELVNAHEGMVRQLLEAERERENLEVLADGHKVRIEELERALTDEKVKFMGTNIGSEEVSPKDTRPPDTTSVGVMRQEFKKMVKELRASHFRSLKAEQEERRRLEGVVRGLRKDPSHLSPSPSPIPPAAPFSAPSTPPTSLAPPSAAPLGKSGLGKSVSALSS